MSKRPNLLILFTDQQRRDTIHALGNERIVTPALDEIAREAVVFDNCFTPAPVCVPARFSMYSGQYPGHTGCCNNNGANVYDGSGFYDAVTRSGYQSCCVGTSATPRRNCPTNRTTIPISSAALRIKTSSTTTVSAAKCITSRRIIR